MKVSELPTAAMILDAMTRPPVPTSGQRGDKRPAPMLDAILALQRSNAEQWDREDDARKDSEDDTMVATAKRAIDQLNSARHRFIEAIDREILLAIDGREGGPLVTESPGMAVDRLSVLVIRLSSTEARAASRAADAGLYAERLPRLRSQIDALGESIDLLLNDLAKGRRRFVAYESLKLYGAEDPARVD